MTKTVYRLWSESHTRYVCPWVVLAVHLFGAGCGHTPNLDETRLPIEVVSAEMGLSTSARDSVAVVAAGDRPQIVVNGRFQLLREQPVSSVVLQVRSAAKKVMFDSSMAPAKQDGEWMVFQGALRAPAKPGDYLVTAQIGDTKISETQLKVE